MLALFEDWSLLATELPVEGVVLVEDVADVSLLAKPLVLPVWLRELDELVEGEDVADAFELFADWSLLATVESVVELVALAVEPLLAKPLVLPVIDAELFADAEPLAEKFVLLLMLVLLFVDWLLAKPLLLEGEVFEADVLLFIEPEVVSVLVALADEEDGEFELLLPYALEPDAFDDPALELL